MIDMLQELMTALAGTGVPVFTPQDLHVAPDGTLLPPPVDKFIIVWPGGAQPHANWVPDAFSTSTPSISAGGRSITQAVEVREAILSALSPTRFTRVNTSPPSYARGANPLTIIPLTFRATIGR